MHINAEWERRTVIFIFFRELLYSLFHSTGFWIWFDLLGLSVCLCILLSVFGSVNSTALALQFCVYLILLVYVIHESKYFVVKKAFTLNFSHWYRHHRASFPPRQTDRQQILLPCVNRTCIPAKNNSPSWL